METAIKGIGCLIIAALLIMGAMIILQGHAIESHGLLANGARSSFERCDQIPGAELYSPDRKTWAYLCFFEQGSRMAVQILSDQRDTDQAREITTIPKEHVSKPWNYVRTLINRDKYRVMTVWGDIPTWFLDMLP